MYSASKGHRLCNKFARSFDRGLSGLFCLNFSWSACSFVFMWFSYKSNFSSDQMVMANLFWLWLYGFIGIVVTSNFFYEWDIYGSKIMMWSREIQTWTDSRNLEKWVCSTREHRSGMIRNGVQADWHWRPHGHK